MPKPYIGIQLRSISFLFLFILLLPLAKAEDTKEKNTMQKQDTI